MKPLKHFDTLGVMLDCSRNAVMNVEEVKRFITLIAKMGYNQLQLYTEDTYEIEGEPLFGYKRGRYTEAELKELDDFAFKAGVELVPNIQTLAHLGGLLRWSQYSKLYDIDDILMVGDEETYALIEKMIAACRKCFRSDKIHVGMDEAHRLGKGKYRDVNGERVRSDILAEHLDRVCAIADKYGFKPMMWSDMFYRLSFTGTDVGSRIPENLTVVHWDYYHVEEEEYLTKLTTHKSWTDRVVFAGGARKWDGLIPHNYVSLLVHEAAFNACIKTGVRDAVITMWGDNGAEASAYSVLPTLCHAACLADGITDMDEIKDKFREWVGCEFDDFMLLDGPDKLGEKGKIYNPSKYQLYNDCFLGLFNDNVLPEDAARYADCGAKLTEAAERVGDYAAVFKAAAALCNVLASKADLGIRTRTAYEQKDTETLHLLVAEYAMLEGKVDEYYYAFRDQWYRENKPHGFETHDYRIGGLKMRIRNNKEQLAAYLRGDVNAIPELEEVVFPAYGEGHTYFNRFHANISANYL